MANIYKSSEHYFSAGGTVTLITAPAQSIVNSIVVSGYVSGIVTVNLEKLGGTSRVIFKVSTDGELTQGPLILEEGDKLNVVGLAGITVVASYVYTGTEVTGMSIGALTDVNTTGVTSGDILIYNGGTGEWEPGTGGGGAVDSVNGQTGTVVLDGSDIAYDAGTTVTQAITGNLNNYNLLKTYIVTTDPDKVVVTKDASNKIEVDATVGSQSIVLTTDGTDAVTVTDTKVDILPVVNAAGGLTVNNNTNTYSLPTNRGLADTVLVSDGAGTTSFQKAILPTSESTLPVQGIDFTLTPTATLTDGRLMYDPDRESLVFQSEHGELAIGEGYKPAFNNTASTIAKGTVVKAAGVLGEKFLIEPFDPSVGFDDELYFIGVTQSDIPAATAGIVVSEGVVKHLDTSAYPVTTVLYASQTAGQLTSTKPIIPNLGVVVAMVTKQDATNGTIYVRPTTYSHIGELHDVAIIAPTAGQLLNYNAGIQGWINTSDVSVTNVAANTASISTVSSDIINVGYALNFLGGGTSTIGVGLSPDDLEIRSNGNVTITLDDDNDEPLQKFAINDGTDVEVFAVDEAGGVTITGNLVNDLNFAAGKSLLVGADEYAFKYIAGSYGLKFDTVNAQYAFTDGAGANLVTFHANNGDTGINRDLEVGRNLNVIGHITVPEFVEGESNKNDRITFSEFGTTAGRIHDIGGLAVGPSSATATYKLGFCEDIAANLILRGLVSVGTTISGTPALGQPLYLGASGTITVTAPSTSGDIVRVIGHYMGEQQAGGSLVYFDPSNDWVEVS